MIGRRKAVFLGSTAVLGWRALPGWAAEQPYEVTHSDAEWRKILTPAQYNILRQQGTEPPFSSPLLNEHRKGVFTCAGVCAAAVFLGNTKFDSGTGWPSFWQPLPNAVRENLGHEPLG
jgi:peptide-methionine (R)-S-oxide reductase